MSIRTRLRALFASDGNPYAGADAPTARRLGALLWLIVAGIATALLPLSPPDAAVGVWGWAAAAAVVAGGLLCARVIARRDIGWDAMLATSYVAVAQVALLQWLAGGLGARTPSCT